MPFSINFDENERYLLNQIAAEKGITLADLIRSVMNRYAITYRKGENEFVKDNNVFAEYKPDAASLGVELRQYMLLCLQSGRVFAKQARFKERSEVPSHE